VEMNASAAQRLNDTNNANDAIATRRFFATNTNLEEISDWITKIIVGLSLVQASLIFEKIKSGAAIFQSHAMPQASGADVVFVVVLVSSTIAGFLFLYMETRTRVTLLFADLENVAGRDTISKRKLDAVLKAPITAGPESGPDKARLGLTAKPAPISEDEEILKIPYDQLKTTDQFAAWASAQARANNYQAAIRALQDAIAKDPNNSELLLRLADIQQRAGNARAVYALVGEARQKNEDDPSLLKRQLYASLYLDPPDSFTKALAIADKIRAIPGMADDPAVQLWVACAQAQRYKWLIANNGNDDQKNDAKAKALAAVQRVVALEPKSDNITRVLLRNLINPNEDQIAAGENDLEVFKEDQAFQQAITS
jgi:tetratricopeptide (TPR) repeat protein